MMKSTLALLAQFSLATALVWPRNDCHGNNCDRAVSRHPISECNSFFSATVVPTAKATTVTITSYYIPDNSATGTVTKRTEGPTPTTVFPTAIPPYASETCTSAAAYSSACSCFGATHATTTVSVPPVSVYTTKTVTVSSFRVEGTASVLRPDKQYLKPDMDPTSPNYLGLEFAPRDHSDPSQIFTLSHGYLTTYTGLFSQQDAGATSEWIWVDTPANITANGWKYVNFNVDPFTLAVSAKASDTGNTVLQVCLFKTTGVPYLDLSAKAGTPEMQNGEPCTPIVLSAILI